MSCPIKRRILQFFFIFSSFWSHIRFFETHFLQVAHRFAKRMSLLSPSTTLGNKPDFLIKVYGLETPLL